MTYPADPDFSAVDALPDGTGADAELTSLAGAIRRTSNEVRGTAAGKAPEAVAKAADDAAAATDGLAENARMLAEGTRIIPGTTTGGTPAAAPSPATTGTSEYGMKTGADVSGRSGSLANALAMPPSNSSTSTSGAHGPSQGANPLGQRTGTGGAMPHMPMMPPMGGGMGAPSGGGQRGADGKDNRPRKASTTLELLNGEDSIAEAVRGGTIAQNRPDNPSRSEK